MGHRGAARSALRLLVGSAILAGTCALGLEGAGADTSISVDAAATTPLRRELLGLNTNFATGSYGYGEPVVLAEVQRLRPALLRFPGGTVGNFYHWKEQGFRRDEMEAAVNARLRRENLQRLDLLEKRRGGRLSFDEFMALSRRAGIQPIVVVNLYTGTPAESAAWVEYARSRGYEIRGWELGNEFYIRIYKDRFPDAASYLREARRHAVAMRAVDPTIQLAVPVSGAPFRAQKDDKWEHRHRWNEELAAEDFYDAYAVHTYWDVPPESDLESLAEALFRDLDRRWPIALEYYEKLFGQREIWLTEWNVRGFRNRAMNNTMLHGLFTGEFLIRLLESPRITLAGYHQLAGGGPWPSLFSRAKRIDAAPRGATVRRAPYFVFELFGEAFESANYQFPVQLANADSESFPRLVAAAVGSDRQGHLLLANRSSSPSSAKLTIVGKLGQAGRQMSCVHHGRLEATNGGNRKTPTRLAPQIGRRSVPVAAGGLKIPANSVCALRFSLS